MSSFNPPMTTLNPSVNAIVSCAAPADAGPRAPRRLPAGFGLTPAAVTSLSLWAGLAHLVGALIG